MLLLTQSDEATNSTNMNLFLTIAASFLALTLRSAAKNISSSTQGEKFLYFGYGSNLLTKRIHINNPTAVRNSSAKLKDYRLDFGDWSEDWKGAVATVVPDKGRHVWGAVWELDKQDMVNLDRQEGVNDNTYFPLQVQVATPSGEQLWCRCYQLCETPTKLEQGEVVPENRLPSALYMNVIIRGALETGLPEDYVQMLRNISHNGYTGDKTSNKTFLISS